MIEIIGNVDKDKLYCAGSFTKLLTTFTTLSFLAEQYDLNQIIDDENFFDQLVANDKAKSFLKIFQKTIGSKFSLHDICSFYTGLPYTFNATSQEIENVDQGNPYKHHCLMDESDFLNHCNNEITQVYPNRCKFNYSELSIIFLGYFIEKNYNTTFEALYKKYIIDAFQLKNSCFSRLKLRKDYTQDLSDRYDLASIAIRDHGYFCYSNGFYTTLNDAKTLLEGLIKNTIFQFMIDIKNARAASNRLMNGLTIEMHLKDNDIVIGYNGLSYSGCNLWAYSTQHRKGYLTLNDDDELANKLVFEKLGYTTFDTVSDHTQRFYRAFLNRYDFSLQEKKPLPNEYQGDYQRVRINDYQLGYIFHVTADTIELRDSDVIKHDIVYLKNIYRIQGKDGIAGERVGLHTARSGNKYISVGGVLLKKYAPLR